MDKDFLWLVIYYLSLFLLLYLAFELAHDF